MVPRPTPAAALAAAANVYCATVGGGLADLRPMPATRIDDGPQGALSRYERQARTRDAALPILLVPPLAAPALCFDLRRGCSLAEHLLNAGRPTYLVDYGGIDFADRRLGLEHWVRAVLPRAMTKVAEDAGDRPLHLVGWCLGGILSLLALARDQALPVCSVALVASPFDFQKVPLIAPLRPIAEVGRGRVVTALYSALGGAPAPLVRAGYQLAGIDKYLMRPWTVTTNLHDRELLAQIEAVDRFTSRMQAYPGRSFGQLYHRFFRTNDLADGRLALDSETLDLAMITRPVLQLAGEADAIAPAAACHHVASLLPNAAPVRLHTAPGGHLGVLTGRRARTTTWRLLEAFLDETANGA